MNISDPVGVLIILNWRNVPDTIECLEFLGESRAPVLVVDNGSGGGAAEELCSYIEQSGHANYHWLALEKNFGFSGGMNRGIRHAAEVLDADAVLLLNSDARCSSEVVDELLAYVASSSELGLVSGLVLFGAGDDRVWFAGGYINKLRGQAVVPHFRERWSSLVQPAADAQESEFVSLAAAALRIDTFRHVGDLDEDFFFGYEEWDYSLRCRAAGYRNEYLPSAVIYHSGDGSHDNFEPAYIYNSYRNKLTFQYKHIGRFFWLWVLWFAAYALTALPRRVSRLNAGRVSTSDVRRAATWAIWDFFRLGRRMTEAQLQDYRSRASR